MIFNVDKQMIIAKHVTLANSKISLKTRETRKFYLQSSVFHDILKKNTGILKTIYYYINQPASNL